MKFQFYKTGVEERIVSFCFVSLCFPYDLSRKITTISIRLQKTGMQNILRDYHVIETTLTTLTKQHQYNKTTLEK